MIEGRRSLCREKVRQSLYPLRVEMVEGAEGVGCPMISHLDRYCRICFPRFELVLVKLVPYVTSFPIIGSRIHVFGLIGAF